jgi:hypothetical protein
MRSLYKDNLPEQDRVFTKTSAYAGRLSEKPEMWPQELTSDLYKQLPYLSDYDVNVNLDRVDPERGYAFGYADIHNKTERPEAEHDEAGLPHLRIPIVVQERSVRPFSTFLDGERVLPLNEERVREQLFNPSTFDLSVSPPQDPSLVEPLMPPHRSGIGMGGDYKTASVRKESMPIGFTTRTLLKNKRSMDPSRVARVKTIAMRMAGKGPVEQGAAKIVMSSATPEEQLYETLQKPAKEKVSFKHISKEQWEAIYNSLDIQKMVQEYGGRDHPAVQNRVYEMATKIYGYHPKPEPPPPGKIEEYKKKLIEKQQKTQQKQFEKGQKMMQEGSKMVGSGQQKKASAERGSLLLAIAPTIREKDAERFVEKVASNATLRAGLQRAGMTELLVEVFDKTKRASVEDRLWAIANNIDPTVITLQKLPGGDFLVKSANVNAFAPGQEAMGQVVPQEEAAQAIGPDQAQAMQPGQTLSAVADPIPEDVLTPEEPNADAIQEFGEYLVQDKMGNQMLGWVFPETLAWDGQFSPTPVALFTNGSSFALQDEVVGELAGKSQTLPVSPPRGEGVFYTVDRDGAIATAPITIKGGMTGPDGGEMYTCVDFMGNQFTVHLSPELAQPQAISESEFALPANWKFMALNQQTQLQGSAEEMNKASAARQAMDTVELYWNGSFNLEGGCGLPKLASKFRYDLDPVSAEFMLGLLGVDGATIKEKLSTARRKGVVKIANLKSITTLAELYEAKKKTASVFASKIPDLRRDLLKEAAALEDESTVDKVLALNFINPENLSTFIDYIPELEQTSEHLAEMLLSGYVGEDAVPEEAVERTMRNMEEVIQALRAVQHAEA